MELYALRDQLSKLLPEAKSLLYKTMNDKKIAFNKAYGSKERAHIEDHKRLKLKEQYLCGVVGAMNRLNDQLHRLKEHEIKTCLVKGDYNE